MGRHLRRLPRRRVRYYLMTMPDETDNLKPTEVDDDSPTVRIDTGEEDVVEIDPFLGQVLGERYAVEAIVGQGGMGTVYRARQRELDRRVAIKVTRPELVYSFHVMERFRREAATTAKLRHPNIVTVYDFATLPNGRSYLVMEFLSGPPLARWLEENAPAPIDRVVGYLKQVCKAVGALHRAGIVHRDIKPSNIILPDPANPDDTVKVVDFGIARLRDAGDGARLTGKNVLGTADYLAPEIIEGGEADPYSDIYALGVVAYEALVGRTPFHGASKSAVLLQHLTKTPARPSSLRPDLPGRIDDVLMRCLEKEPARRYQSADGLAEALEAATTPETAPNLPWASATSVQEAAPATSSSDVVAPDRARILVIEDEEDMRTVSRTVLQDAGYEVTTSADGIEALMRLGAGTYDLILSDVDMPNLDGFKLLEVVSRKGIHTPVIFITGKVEAENEVRGLELGAQDYLRKPVSPAVLLARVRIALARRRT
jgi:serine/threonine protein kinase